MNERPRGEQNPPQEPITFHVDPDVYSGLAALEKTSENPLGDRLGNPHTKRLITVAKTPDNLPWDHKDIDLSDGRIAVRMRIRQANKFVSDDYFFTMDPAGITTEVESKQLGGHRDQQPLPPFSEELLLRELNAAKKSQATLTSGLKVSITHST